MAQGPAPASRSSFDLSRLTNADKVIAGAAGLFFIWSFIPVWYDFEIGPFASSINGWHGTVFVAAILSLLALVWLALRLANVDVGLNLRPGLVDLALAAGGLLFTLLGLVAKPGGYGLSWGYFVGLLLALAWAYGGWMKYSEPLPARWETGSTRTTGTTGTPGVMETGGEAGYTGGMTGTTPGQEPYPPQQGTTPPQTPGEYPPNEPGYPPQAPPER